MAGPADSVRNARPARTRGEGHLHVGVTSRAKWDRRRRACLGAMAIGGPAGTFATQSALGRKSRRCNNLGSYAWDKRRAKHTETLSTIDRAVAHAQCAQMQSYPAMS